MEQSYGAYPTGCAGLYPADEEHIRSYLEAARAEKEASYLDAVVRGSRCQAEIAGKAA